MKAMQLKRFSLIEQNPLELVELPVPQPGPDEVLISITSGR